MVQSARGGTREKASFKKMQPLLAYAAAHLEDDLSLAVLARWARRSTFHLHRALAAVAGETPKQFTMRLRLERAAVQLLLGRDSILDVALSCGFQSHEVFCRAFRRRFGVTPRAYRERGFLNRVQASQAARHAMLVSQVGPCVRLYHTPEDWRLQTNQMTYAIVKRELAPQPVLVVRRRIKPSEIAPVLAEVLGNIFLYAQQNGMAFAGQPFTRYLEWGPGSWKIEAGMPVTALADVRSRETSGASEIQAATLPGGSVAMTTHIGPYEKLVEAHAAVQQWIEAQGLTAAGAPWESYVTDPAEYPDPKDWKTDVFWPLAL